MLFYHPLRARLVFSLLLLAALSTQLLNAQWQSYADQLDRPDLPAFIKAMHAERPEVAEVERLYEAYYREVIEPEEKAYKAANPGMKFKNQYAFAYKRWRGQVLPFLTDDGHVDYSPSARRQKQQTIDRLHAAGTARSGNNWLPRGPFEVISPDDGTRISSIANVFDYYSFRFSSDNIYAGTESGGLFYSANGGVSWTHISKDMDFRWVQAVTYFDSQPDEVLIGTPGKLWYSVNGGDSWDEASISVPAGMELSDNFQVYELLYTSGSEVNSRVYAATSDGLMISVDYGVNWALQFSATGGRVTSIVEQPNDPSTLYMIQNFPVSKGGSGNSFCVKLTDFGGGQEILSNGWYELPAADEGKINIWGGSLAVSPADPDRVYAFLNEKNSAADASIQFYGQVGVYRSDNGGDNWTRVTDYLGPPYNMTDRWNLASWGDAGFADFEYNQVDYLNNSLAVSTLDADHLLLGGLSLWESFDGGSTWTSIGGYPSTIPNIHPDLRRVKFRNTGPDSEVLSFASDGGYDFSPTGNPADHESRTFGLYAHEFWAFDADSRMPIRGGGSYHNGNNIWREGYGLNSWKHLGGGEDAAGSVQYGEEVRFFARDQTPVARVPGSDITSSEEGYSSILDNPDFKHNEALFADEYRSGNITTSALNPEIHYWGNGSKFIRSSDDFISAEVLHDFGSNYYLQQIEHSPDNPNVIWVKAERSSPTRWVLFNSEDGGENWTEMGEPQDKNFVLHAISDFGLYRIFPTGTNGNKVFYSFTGGNSWVNFTEPIMDNVQVRGITEVRGLQGGLFVATSGGGVMRLLQSGWVLCNEALYPGIVPQQLTYNYATRSLMLATRGSGLWEMVIDEPIIDDPNIAFASDGSDYYCTGTPVHFFNRSENAAGSNYNWSFPGGSPSTSTDENPTVVYDEPGTYPVTFSWADNFNNSSQLITSIAYITVAPDEAETLAADFEDLELPESWLIYDANESGESWALTDLAGGYGISTNSMIFENYEIDEPGSYEELRTASIDFSDIAEAEVTYDFAYAQYTDATNDSLAVYVVAECGSVRVLQYLEGGAGLATAPADIDFFVPTADQWITGFIDMSPFAGLEDVHLVFQSRGYFGNNLYLDNVNLSGVVSSTEEVGLIEQSLRVSPNPNRGTFRVTADLPAGFNGTLELLDPLGRRVHQSRLSPTGRLAEDISVPNLSAGIYFLRIRGQGMLVSHKIMIQK